MQNVKLEVKGSTLTIVVDLDQNLGPSKSGKTIMVATTSGNVSLGDAKGTTLGLNIYRKAV